MESESTAPHTQLLADTLRRHREGHNQSLGELSRLTGLSKTSLQRLETGQANPSLETLWRLSRALGLSIGQLIEPSAEQPARIRHADEGPIVESRYGMRARLLQTDNTRHRTEVFELTLPPGARFHGEAHDTGSHELVYCTKGSVSTGPENAPLKLNVGDTAYFDGANAHIYAAGPNGGRAILVMSYPPNPA